MILNDKSDRCGRFYRLSGSCDQRLSMTPAAVPRRMYPYGLTWRFGNVTMGVATLARAFAALAGVGLLPLTRNAGEAAARIVTGW